MTIRNLAKEIHRKESNKNTCVHGSMNFFCMTCCWTSLSTEYKALPPKIQNAPKRCGNDTDHAPNFQFFGTMPFFFRNGKSMSNYH